MNEEEENPDGLQDEIVNHLENLNKNFAQYFSNTKSSNLDWIRNPFLLDLDTMDDSNMQNDDLIDLKSKAVLKQSFRSQTIDQLEVNEDQGKKLPERRARHAFSTVHHYSTYLLFRRT